MGPALLIITAGAIWTVWRIVTSPTHDEAARMEAAVETRPSGKPLSPLLLQHQREMWQP